MLVSQAIQLVSSESIKLGPCSPRCPTIRLKLRHCTQTPLGVGGNIAARAELAVTTAHAVAESRTAPQRRAETPKHCAPSTKPSLSCDAVRSDRLDSTRGAAEALLVKGGIHRALDETGPAIDALLAVPPHLTLDEDTLYYLATGLLNRDAFDSSARAVYLDYVAHLVDDGELDRHERNLVRLRRLSTPPVADPDALGTSRDWNNALLQRKKSLSWPTTISG